MPSLEGVDAKIRRARHHIDELNELVRTAIDSSGCDFVFDSELDAGQHVLRVYGVPEIDPDWRLILGDCVHNLRSALDHLAWQLVEMDNQTPTIETQFPIHEAPLDKKGNLRLAEIKPSIQRKDIRDLVERVQPHRGIDGRWVDPHESFLWALKCLSNIDKHRLLLVVTCIFETNQLSWSWGGNEEPPTKGPIRWNPAPLHDGDPVLWFTFTRGKVPEGFDPHPALRISVREHEAPLLASLSIQNALELLTYEVEDEVVRLFRPLFS